VNSGSSLANLVHHEVDPVEAALYQAHVAMVTQQRKEITAEYDAKNKQALSTNLAVIVTAVSLGAVLAVAFTLLLLFVLRRTSKAAPAEVHGEDLTNQGSGI
jgi:hypothetical protein